MFRSIDIPINLEFKEKDIELAKKVLELIKNHRKTEKVVWGSVNYKFA